MSERPTYVTTPIIVKAIINCQASIKNNTNNSIKYHGGILNSAGAYIDYINNSQIVLIADVVSNDDVDVPATMSYFLICIN